MTGRTFNFVLIICLAGSSNFCRVSAGSEPTGVQEDSTLRIYMPRDVTVKDDCLKLGRVSIIRGEESLVARAGEIALGRFSVPGQRIIVDRSMLLSRLACNGIPPSQVTLTGAGEITVKKQQQVIKGAEFVELASSFLKKDLPSDSVCQFTPIRVPDDLVLPATSEDIEIFPRLAKNGARNQAKVQIVVRAGDEQIGTREVSFRLKYNCSRAVALLDIPAGTVISPDNVKVEKTLSSYSESADWNGAVDSVYGLVARRRLPANAVIRPHMVGSVKPDVVVERNKNVVIRVQRPGLSLTATGKAMQNGRVGDCIRVKVKITDAARIIVAKVNEDGTVQPVL